MTKFLLAAVLFVLTGAADAQTGVIEGQVGEITKDEIVMQSGERYPLIKTRTRYTDLNRNYLTLFYDTLSIVNGEPANVTFNTFYDIGYLKKARLTLKNGRVIRLDLLDLEQ